MGSLIRILGLKNKIGTCILLLNKKDNGLQMTDKQIINYIIEENFNGQIKKNVPKDIKKNSVKFLNYIKEKANISDEEFQRYIYVIETTKPMPHTQLLLFIIEELEREGLRWNGRKEIFNILVPNEAWEEYRKSWYQWSTQYVENITKNRIRQSIQEVLGFNSFVWDMPEKEQRRIIPQKIKNFLKKDLRDSPRKRNSIDLSSIKPSELNITEEQKMVLDEIREETNDNIANILKDEQNYFLAKKENQKFLLELLTILYNRGFYTFLNSTLFPSLLRYNREKKHVKIKEAYTLLYLNKYNYRETFYLLESILRDTEDKKIDITTMMVSNFKKNELKKENITKDDFYRILIESIKCYGNIYEDNKSYHYYPAINLVYMVKLLEINFPNHEESYKHDIGKIYQLAQSSIKRAKIEDKDLQYYATISDLEFCLIMNKPNTFTKMEEALEKYNPEISLIKRPLLQIQYFVNFIKKFSSNYSIPKRFTETIELFKDYIYLKENQLC